MARAASAQRSMFRRFRRARRLIWPARNPAPGRNRYPLAVMDEEIMVDSPLVGRHQLRNIALAIATAEELAQFGFKVTPKQIEQGIRETHWPGRFQVLAAVSGDGSAGDGARRRAQSSGSVGLALGAVGELSRARVDVRLRGDARQGNPGDRGDPVSDRRTGSADAGQQSTRRDDQRTAAGRVANRRNVLHEEPSVPACAGESAAS